LNIVVAIDGPAASGKSTVARGVAKALNAIYVDSGSFYRGVTWWVLRAGIPAGDSAGVIRGLATLQFKKILRDQAVCYLVDGEDPGSAIRGEAVAERVSEIAAIPEVRNQVNGWLRETRELGPVIVMEGRDIGSVVFPDTPHKFYLDADPAERARRRHAETIAREEHRDVAQVLESLRRRDTRDSGRAEAPLKVASGAQVIDTTHRTIDEVIQAIVAQIRARDTAR
jgi:cytidylate kinase